MKILDFFVLAIALEWCEGRQTERSMEIYIFIRYIIRLKMELAEAGEKGSAQKKSINDDDVQFGGEDEKRSKISPKEIRKIYNLNTFFIPSQLSVRLTARGFQARERGKRQIEIGSFECFSTSKRIMPNNPQIRLLILRSDEEVSQEFPGLFVIGLRFFLRRIFYSLRRRLLLFYDSV